VGKCPGELPQLKADQPFELPGRNVDRFRQSGSIVLGKNRRGARYPGFQAADLVPIARLATIEVPQTHLNPKDTRAETLQRSRNDAFNPANELFITAEGVVTIDQDLHSPSPQSSSPGTPQTACRVAVAGTSPFWLPIHRSLGRRIIGISHAR
jgi:hypothetical protein